MTEENKRLDLVKEIAEALTKYRKIEGRFWKAKLRADWSDGAYYYSHHSYSHLLQRFRNLDGVNVLTKIKADMKHDKILKVLNRSIKSS